MIDFERLGMLYANKFDSLPEVAQHRMLQLLLEGARYRLGTENLLSTDCSGVLSWPLLLMGYRVRVTADEFYRIFYTIDYESTHTWRDETLAVFYLEGGVATHVSAGVGRQVILDAWDEAHPVELKDLPTTVTWYREHGYDVKLRGLDWDAMHAIMLSSGAYGVDELVTALTTHE